MSQLGPGFKPFSHRFLQRLARGQPMGLGAYMYVAHRLTGLVLIAYLIAHLIVVGAVLSGENGFNQMMTMTGNRLIQMGELVLVWVALFHLLNGLRLIVLSLAPDVSQRTLAYGVVVVSIVVPLASIPLFMGVSL
ncbi:MAG: succinate dehydrogenase, cytochrome b556 subunit [Chloroflexi bacterium]|nr:succinate dehydrogenase, cytochrome b556 subunit [Chloroflexota bacterium]